MNDRSYALVAILTCMSPDFPAREPFCVVHNVRKRMTLGSSGHTRRISEAELIFKPCLRIVLFH